MGPQRPSLQQFVLTQRHRVGALTWALHQVLPWEGGTTHPVSEEEYKGPERLSHRPKVTQL